MLQSRVFKNTCILYVLCNMYYIMQFQLQGNIVVKQRFEDMMGSLVKYRSQVRDFAKNADSHLSQGMVRLFK